MSRGEGPSHNDEGMTRRDFLKVLGIGAAAVATGAAVEGINLHEKKIHEDVRAEMLNGQKEERRVGHWGQGEKDENGEFLPTTVSELRDNAGWKNEFEDEFIESLRLLNPGGVDEKGQIQPGIYKTPIHSNENK